MNNSELIILENKYKSKSRNRYYKKYVLRIKTNSGTNFLPLRKIDIPILCKTLGLKIKDAEMEDSE